MRLSTLVLTIISLLTVACGSDPVAVAELQWRINYGDWTEDSSNDDYRGCDNAPEVNARGIAYPEIFKVHVHLTDPAGIIPGYDQRVECNIGIGEGTLSLRGLVRQAWDVAISAEAEDGTILYQYVEEEVDMSTLQTFSWELQAKTSETHFYPKFSGTASGGLECPEGVTTSRWSLYLNDMTTPAEEASVTGEGAACDAFNVAEEIIIRNVPVDPQAGANNSYVPTSYKLVVEGLDASGSAVWCGQETNRIFRPGLNGNGTNTDISLASGACN
jgi:hypothetical protein